MAVVEDIFLDALGLVGIEAAAHAETAMLNRITSDFNKALQKVFALGPRIWSEKMAGTTIRAPESLTSLTYTDGTTVLSGASLAAHMHNCTIVIGSDGQQNRVVETGSGTYALLFPYAGTSAAGNGTATVYYDAINLASNAVEILPPIQLVGYGQLWPLTAQVDLYEPGSYSDDHGRVSSYAMPWSDRDGQREINQPREYIVEANRRYDGAITVCIRVNPLPPTLYRLRWQQRYAAPRITGIADTTAYLIPHDYIESILMPIVRKNFSTWPNFTGRTEGLDDDVADAIGILNRISQPQQHIETLVDASDLSGCY
jgi:hypothetical protein